MRALFTHNMFTAMRLVGATLLLSGCQTLHPGWSSLAYVEIEGASIERVQKAIVQVFTAEHYEVKYSSEQEIDFIREGTLNDRLQYARYQEGLQMRVEVTLEPFGAGAVLVRADAYAVSDGSGRSPVKLLKVTRRPYMQLLERVKKTAKMPLTTP